MSFTSKPIRQKPRRHLMRSVKKYPSFLIRGFCVTLGWLKKIHGKRLSYGVGFLMILFGFFVVYRVTLGVYHWARGFDPKSILFALGSDLKKDSHGYTNILLLGLGDSNHDGFELIDTIMVASIDYRKNSVALFSVPRDFYVTDYGTRVNEIYRDNRTKKGEEGALDAMKEAVAKIVDLEIQYYTKVSFSAFVEVIDHLGGVDVEVDQDIVDPYYPNATEDGYQTFAIKAGSHTLDGETALKFVRSRKTTSDFDRARRQQKVLSALQEKALSQKILTNSGAIKKIFQSVSQNLSTNLSFGEMIALAGYATHMDRARLVSKVIHDDPSQEGGFLYTPERQYYNGAFVLVPEGTDYDVLHRYTHLVFYHREFFINQPRIELLNGTKRPGAARILANRLERFGFKIVSMGNAYNKEDSKKPIEKTTISTYRWSKDVTGAIHYEQQDFLDALSQWVQGEVLPAEQGGEGSSIDISIVLGKDYLTQ